jgi:hypothetical protein
MKYFTAFVLVFTFFTSAPFSWSRQGTSQSPAPAPPSFPNVLKTPAKVSPSSPNVLPNKGSIEQGTYKNPSIGIELTPAADLHWEDPEMKGTPGTTPLLIVVKATEGGLLSGLFSPKSVMIFEADALAYYPENKRSTPLYVDRVIRTNKALGYQMVNEVTQDQISGTPFVRADFVKGDVHESVLVTSRNEYAFVFIFGGSDFEGINKIIASTKVKLTP